eukprot:9139425-Pyramimonas_sp.AAC.1
MHVGRQPKNLAAVAQCRLANRAGPPPPPPTLQNEPHSSTNSCISCRGEAGAGLASPAALKEGLEYQGVGGLLTANKAPPPASLCLRAHAFHYWSRLRSASRCRAVA